MPCTGGGVRMPVALEAIDAALAAPIPYTADRAVGG